MLKQIKVSKHEKLQLLVVTRALDCVFSSSHSKAVPRLEMALNKTGIRSEGVWGHTKTLFLFGLEHSQSLSCIIDSHQ